jgi:hypothetical protein
VNHRSSVRPLVPRVVAALALLLVFGGCAGRDFARPPADAFTLGKTTEADIRQKFGDPYRQGTTVRNGETMKTLSYAYAAGAGALAGGITPARGLGFYFWNDVLVGHEFVSSFEEDKTDFDGTKAQQIRKGETTESGVTTLLGPPQGAYVYPMVADKTGRGLVYMYAQTKGSAFSLKFYQQLLVVTIGSTGVVSDVQLTSQGER